MAKTTKSLQTKFKDTALLETENVKLKKENRALRQTIDKLLKQTEKTKALSNVIRLEMSPEQEILEVQIQNLRAISRERILTLEETKMLDLHIKNKRLLDDKSTVNADYKEVPKGLTEEDLIEIAGNVEIEEEKPTKKSRNKSKASS